MTAARYAFVESERPVPTRPGFKVGQ